MADCLCFLMLSSISSHLISDLIYPTSFLHFFNRERERKWGVFSGSCPISAFIKNNSNPAFHITHMLRRQKHLFYHLCSSSPGICKDRIYSSVYWDVGSKLSHTGFLYWQMLFGSKNRHGKDLLFQWIIMESLELCILQNIKI